MKRINVKLLVILAVGALFLVVGVHLLHAFQIDRNAGILLEQAKTARKEGDLREAFKRYHQYLKHRDDPDAMAARSAIAAELAKDPQATRTDILQAMNVMEETLRAYPDLVATRRQLVDLYITYRLYAQALENIKVIEAAGGADPDFEVKSAQCKMMLGKEAEAKVKLSQLIGWNPSTKAFDQKARAPKQIDAYVLLADLLRQKESDPTTADTVMNQLVANNDGSATAHLSRGRYLLARKDDDNAQAEIKRALELAPQDAEVVAAAAERAIEKNDLPEAQQLLERGLKDHPKDEDLYRLLTSLSAKKGGSADALKQVDAGLKSMPKSLTLRHTKLQLLMQNNDLKGARSLIADLRKDGDQAYILEAYEARMLMSEKKFREASEILKKLRPRLVQVAPLVAENEWLLGSCYESLGETDRQIDAYSLAIKADPNHVAALQGRARGLKLVGRLKDAQNDLARLEKLVGDKSPDSDDARRVRQEVLGLRLTEQLRKPKDERDWKEVDQAMEEVLKDPKLSDVQKAVFEAQVYLQKDEVGKAHELLNAARKKFPKDLLVWAGLSDVLQKEKPENMKPFLDLAEKELGDSAWLRLRRAEFLLDQRPEGSQEGLSKLEEGVDKYPKEVQIGFWHGLGYAYYKNRDFDNAARCWQQVAKLNPDNMRVREMLLALGKDTKNEELIKAQLEAIRRAQGATSALYYYGEGLLAVCQVRNKTKEKIALADARKSVEQALRLRPDWYELPRLEGEIDELEGNVDAAIDDYKRACELGPVNAGVARRLVELLYAQNRLQEAQDAMKYIGAGAGAVGQVEKLDRIKDEMNLQKGNTDAAIASAKKGAEENPDDVLSQLWYGQVLERTDRGDEAEAVYRAAAEKNPKSPVAWVRLVARLANAKKRPEAEAAIREAEKSLPEDEAPLVLGQLAELVGDPQRAEIQYQAALEAKPKDALVLRSLASYYLRTNRPALATSHLDHLIAADPKADAVAAAQAPWARRAKAQVLADKGDYPSFRKALSLIDDNRVDGRLSTEDVVLKAELLSKRSDVQSRADAIKLLEDLSQQRKLTPREQHTLAELYERAGRWREGRDQMLALVDRNAADPSLLASYIKMLGQRGNLEDMSRWLDQLVRAQPNSMVTQELKARLLVKQGQADKAVELLKETVPRPLPAQNVSLLLRLAGLLEELEQYAAAESFLREYVEHEPRATLKLATFLGMHGNLDEAFALLEESRKSQPLNVVVRAALASLRARPHEATKKQFQTAEDWLQKGLADEPQSADLQVELADLRDLQGKYDEVIRIYRDVLTRSGVGDQDKAVVKNNLAFLLAMRGTNKSDADESLRLIQEAMDYFGPNGDLLDTRAMAYLAQGENKLALADLKASIADSSSGHKYFHLAMAQHAANDKRAATEAFNECKRLKLDPNRLSKWERVRYDQLSKELRTN